MKPGIKLGRYHILSSLGAGAMGEVYRARDTKIRRDVAIKVLPGLFSSDPDRLRRFEQEVQAAGALNHPNILVIHDVGMHAGAPYVVSELLRGRTLRDFLKGRKLPISKAIELAIPIARGLSAAHDKRIIHRDLKPENIFITDDEQVKILDFGLAKLLRSPLPEEAKTDAPTLPPESRAGTITGTIGYMSPEQARGETHKVDQRSDIFSFGSVFFEMLTGQRAFKGRSAVDTMSAILNEDPIATEGGAQSLPHIATRILRHCLEKEPDKRFQCAADLVFDLETLQATLQTDVEMPARPLEPKRLALKAAAVLLLLTVVILAFAFGRRARTDSLPDFSQLTFRRGTIWSARFTPSADTIIYTASFDGGALDIFSARTDSHESRTLGIPGSSLLSVSSTGELAILRSGVHLGHFSSRGTLAQMPLSGTTPRALLNDIQEADWSPDGTSMAIVRHVGEQDRLEYPVNRSLYESSGWISDIRISPAGDLVAFLDHPAEGDNRGKVVMVNLEGQRTALTQEWSSVDGLAWLPDGDEVGFTARKSGEASALYAVTLTGKERVVLRVPAHLRLHDISQTGRVLLTRGYDRTDFFGLHPGESVARSLSWLDRGRVRDLSTDGEMFIFSYWGEGSGTNYITYLRRTDGSAPVPLGEGAAWALSPDGTYVLATLSAPPQLVMLPTGVGEVKRIENDQIEQYGLGASWLPDGEHVLFVGREKGKSMRCYVQNLKGGPPRAVTPEGITGTSVSPDGKYLVAEDKKQDKMIYPIEPGPAQPPKGLNADDTVIRWSANPNSLFVFDRSQTPLVIFEVNIVTGARRSVRKIVPTDATGMLGQIHVFLTPDGSGCVYDFRRYLSDLYIADGLID